MNTSKIKPTVPGITSKIPTIKRPVPVSSTSTRHEPVTTTIKSTKPVPTFTQPSHPKTPNHKTTLDSKANDTKVQPQPIQQTNKENKENVSLNSTKKSQDTKVKGYTELKKNEERLSEMVNRFELEKQNHSQHILAIEQKHKEELRAKEEIIRNLQYQLEASQERTHNAESIPNLDTLNTFQEDISTITTRNKTLESLLEELNVDVVALERIPAATVMNIEEIELRFQEFKEAFESDYETTTRCIKQKGELLACMGQMEISVTPNVDNENEVERESGSPSVSSNGPSPQRSEKGEERMEGQQ